ncbi:hypothetical protein BTA51_02405 [Hahella sp. CCB-MM4]|uniref:DUF2589 domain-containing protein n=1 Tax=Hahella sp. (strain CCB-MM4) TaxID=1926491 RepID=UPI000B9C47E0|nr:DUF2589 domain-containing protein [Hahella sp. CCB-MM4]OZG75256.1 hypothetical protein BTA51_02405 [Hahella sp. CCB-MM4]
MDDDSEKQPPPEPPGEDDDSTSPTRLTLEQALLAPLDSILKAQLHSARSFLNLLLQLGYPHREGAGDGHPYSLEFKFNKDGETQKLSVPALALVPIAPLAVDSAQFELEMSARRVVKHAQIRESEGKKAVSNQAGQTFDRYHRPWFLVDKPVNIEGDIVSTPTGDAAKHRESQSAIKININVKSIPLPAGLDKLLTSMTNMSQILPVDDTPSTNHQDKEDQQDKDNTTP